jgi:hypothetical protein
MPEQPPLSSFPDYENGVRVVWDGVEYLAPLVGTDGSGSSWVAIFGNPAMFGNGADNGVPFMFCLGAAPLPNIEVFYADTNTHTMAIVKRVETVHKLDEKYIPDTIARKSDIPEIDPTLTIEGAAADAKATGDAIGAVSELVGDVAVATQITEAIASIPQADWNQNDPNAPDYVKNRTHFYGRGLVPIIQANGGGKDYGSGLMEYRGVLPVGEFE